MKHECDFPKCKMCCWMNLVIGAVVGAVLVLLVK